MCTPTHPLSISEIWKVQRSRGTAMKIIHNPSTRDPGASKTSSSCDGGLAPSHPHPRPRSHPWGAEALLEDELFLYEGRSWLRLLTSPVPCVAVPSGALQPVTEVRRHPSWVWTWPFSLSPFATDCIYLDRNLLCLHQGCIKVHGKQANSTKHKGQQRVHSRDLGPLWVGRCCGFPFLSLKWSQP